MKMLNSVIKVNDSDAVFSQTSSKGNQKKWYTEGKWIKADDLGYEGLSETVCSRLAAALDFPFGYVEYQPCIIHDTKRDKKMTGCCSDSFITTGVNEITLGRLMKSVFNTDPAVFFDSGISAEEKAEFVTQKLSGIRGLEKAGEYFSALFRFDWLVLNEDRHYHNIIFIYDREKFYFAPLFDCGAALLSDLSDDYPMATPTGICMRNVKAKPFSKSFSRQCKFFESVYGNILEVRPVNIKISDLYGFYDEKIINRVCDVLNNQYSIFGLKDKINFI